MSVGYWHSKDGIKAITTAPAPPYSVLGKRKGLYHNAGNYGNPSSHNPFHTYTTTATGLHEFSMMHGIDKTDHSFCLSRGGETVSHSEWKFIVSIIQRSKLGMTSQHETKQQQQQIHTFRRV